LCPECRSSYAQRQGAWRHIRTVHKPRQCSLCEFEYARPYDYRAHLENKHLIVNPDLILGKAPGSRGRAAILTGFELIPQQQPLPPPAVEDQQTWAGSQLYPPAPPPAVEDQQPWVGSQLYPLAPPPAVEGPQNWVGSQLSPPALPPAVEDRQPWARSQLYPPVPPPAVEDQQPWVRSQLYPPAPPPAVEGQQNWAGSQLNSPTPPSLAGTRVISVSQPGLHVIPLVSFPSNPETATTPAHFPPGGGNHGTLFSEDGSFGPKLSEADLLALASIITNFTSMESGGSGAPAEV
jgi:hypothetical protein